MNKEEYIRIQEGRSGTGNLELSSWAVKFLEKYSEYLVEPILDIGCGNGNLMNRLKEMGLFSMGVDISRLSSKNGLKKNLFPIINQNIENELPFPDKSFRTAISFQTLEHCLDIEKAIKNIDRVLDGTVCIVVPTHDGTENKDLGHFAYIPDLETLIKYFKDYEILVTEEKAEDMNGMLLIAKNN